MKSILSIFLACCTAFAFADDDSFFEKTQEKVPVHAIAPFAAEEPIFEDDDETTQACEEEGCDGIHEESRLKACGPNNGLYHASYVDWPRYKANFGMEKLFVRFPQRPAISQTSQLLTAYAYDNAVLYSLAGYFPPLGNIEPASWFDKILYTADHYPFTLISSTVFQAANGDWVLDYVAHDYIQNLILKARAFVTPFNAYTLQCVKPNGMRDYFDYFLDNFFVKCTCN
jgi:hypothetical protein